MAMEQIGKYCGLWASTRSSSEPSWEEQAFARDAAAAAHLGGCVWPPRSYSCSFCQREFRSAQALGGHMNVHRRDRALLRQVSSPDDDDGQEAASGEQPKPQGPLFCRAAGSSNPSTTATGSSNTALSAAKGDVNHGTAPPPPSYLASIINESKNKRLFMPMIPASMTTREEVMGQCDDHGDGDVESGRMKRRRLLDPPFVAVSMVAASESQGIVDPDAKGLQAIGSSKIT
ncbi:hypothetical protein EJB05_25643, partial [Eragrostis curvula]